MQSSEEGVLSEEGGSGCSRPRRNDDKMHQKGSIIAPVNTTAVMGTNDQATVSKRSVERLYYPQPHYIRHFVTKPKRRAPLVNRGYWLRMQVIEHQIRQFLSQADGSRQVIINLGAGFDASPFRLLDTAPYLCKHAHFVDVDFPDVIARKTASILSTELRKIVPPIETTQAQNATTLQSNQYEAIGCDLTDIEKLSKALQSFHTDQVLIVAEVALVYMDPEAADRVIQWAATFPKARFCLLEQMLPKGPEYPFAARMLHHFRANKGNLKGLERYSTGAEQVARFQSLGWRQVKLNSLWQCWQDQDFVQTSQRTGLNAIEAFDEWEELALFAAHYFVLYAQDPKSQDRAAVPASTQFFDRPYAKAIEDAIQQDETALKEQRSRQTRHTPLPRCYGVALPWVLEGFAHHGGHDGTSRLDVTDFDQVDGGGPNPSMVIFPPKGVRLHHTVTILNEQLDCLMIGGRASPEAIFSDCWLRENGIWKPAEPLPQNLYRHAAVACCYEDKTSAVLVFGGRTDLVHASATFYIWTRHNGWTSFVSKYPSLTPRFSSKLLAFEDGNAGLLVGGVGLDGAIINEAYHWKLVAGNSIEVWPVTDLNPETRQSICRLGSTLNSTPIAHVLAGGIQGDGLPPDEIAVLQIRCDHDADDELPSVYTNTISETLLDRQSLRRHMLIGHAAAYVPGALICYGGGAVCFSFGTYVNSALFHLPFAAHSPPVRMQYLGTLPSYQQEALPANAEGREANTDHFQQVPRLTITNPQKLAARIRSDTPFVLSGADVGPCLTKWTNEYLTKTMNPDRLVAVHHTADRHMRFESKNFQIEKWTVDRLIKTASASGLVYLRAVAADGAEQPAMLERDFPGLAPDVHLPSELGVTAEMLHSSVLRISGRVHMWLHYDTMHNFLVQVRGVKRLLLFPPSAVSLLQIPPSRSSSDLNVFSPRVLQSLTEQGVQPQEVVLQPGEILYIPALWCHAACPTAGMSVAVNYFFRAAHGSYAQGRDVYGNRDVAEYDMARQDVQRALRRLQNLPSSMADFYRRRLGDEWASQI